MKISGITSQPSLNVSIPEGEISKVKVGQTIKATILNVTPDEVTLKLDDGTTMSAKVQSSLNAAIGDNIELVVKDKSQGQFILQTVKDANLLAGKLEDIKDLLFNLKLPINDKNIDIVQNLMNLKMPVNSENMKLALSIISNFENINPQKAVFMIANKIVPDEKNVQLLNTNIIKDVFKNEFTNLENRILDIPDNNVKAQILDALNTNDFKNNPKIEQLKNVIETLITNNDLPKNEVIQSIAKNIVSIIDELPSENKDTTFKNMDFKSIEGQLKNTIEVLKQNTKEIENIITKYENNEIPHEELETQIDKLLIPIKSALVKDVNNILDKVKNNNDIKKDDIDIDINNSIKKAINEISIKVSKDLDSKDLNVNELYKDIYKKLESIKNIATENSSSKELTSGITNIQDNIKFINNVNNNMAYIPIPLNIDNNRTTGQLYILKNNKHARIDSQNASLYLALDMPNLGAVGILVNVDKNNLSLNFKSESDKSIDVIRNNYPKLIEVLKNKSYNVLDVTFSVFNNEINMLNVTNVLGEKIKTRTFDIRV